LFNKLLGLSVASWAVLRLVHAGDAECFSIVRIFISTLNFSVGILFFFRDSVKTHGSLSAISANLPSLIISGFAFKMTAPLNQWAKFLVVIFVSGTLLTMCAFVTLGRSFALLPAVRKIVTDGPFRFIRHHAYTGEFLMILSQTNFVASWLMIIVLSLIVMRILAEESILKTDGVYQEYLETVKWRLLLKVW